MKKIISFFVTIAMCLSLIGGIVFVEGVASNVIPKASAALFTQDQVANLTLPTEQWEGVTSYPITTIVNGSTTSTGNVKMMWDSTALYFYLEISDTTKNSQDTLSLILSPKNEEYGANAGIYPGNFDIPGQGWIPGGGGGFQPQGGSLTLGAGCIWNARYVDADQKYYVCIKAVLPSSLQSLLVTGAQMGVDLIYHDGTDWNTRNTANNIRLFGSLNNQGTTNSGMGTVSLGDEVFRIKSGNAAKGTARVDLVKEDAWDLVPEYSLTRKMVYATGKPAITEDVKFRMMWDELGMYFWTEVKDSTPFVTVNGSPERNSLYLTDALSYYLDLENTHTIADQGFAGHVVGQWFISGSKDFSGNLGGGSYIQPSTTLKAKTTADGYIFESFIKWSAGFVPTIDKVIGVDLCYTDNTDGSGRTGEIYWSCDDGLAFQKVNKFGDVKLVDLGIDTDMTIKPIEATPGLAKPTSSDTSKDEFGSYMTKISWTKVLAASYYNINIFEVTGSGDEKTYTFVRTQENIDTLNDEIFSLDDGKTYAFQVIGLNSDDAVAGVFDLIEVNMTSGVNATPTNAPDDNGSPTSGDSNAIIYLLMIFIAISSIIISRKKRLLCR